MAEGECNVAGNSTMIERRDDSSGGKERDPPAHESSRDLFGVQLEVCLYFNKFKLMWNLFKPTVLNIKIISNVYTFLNKYTPVTLLYCD